MTPAQPQNKSSDRQRSKHSLRREHRDAGKLINRIFLGWNQPLLTGAIEFLHEKYCRGSSWDLDNVVLVLPGMLAARRLEQLLAIRAAEESLNLRPPQLVTFGDLTEKLYKAKYPFASNLQQSLAWVAALKSMSVDELEPLLVRPPGGDQNQPWIELASLLAQLHRELSSDLTMFSDVIELLQDDSDSARWIVLAELQNRYLDILTKQGLWDIQTARRIAIQKNEVALADERDIVMLGTVDLNRTQRYFVDIIGSAVTVLIGAPPSWQAGFDNYGSLRANYWQDICVKIPPQNLITTVNAASAAEAVVSQIALWSPDLSPQQITIGLLDADLLPTLVQRCERSNIRTRLGAGFFSPLNQTVPVRLLRSVGEFLSSGSFESFSALIRLPAVAKVLALNSELPSNYLSQIDRYYSQTILASVRLADFPQVEGYDAFQQTLDTLDAWLQPLRADKMQLQHWSEPICNVLTVAFQNELIGLDENTGTKLFNACLQVSQVLEQIGDLPEEFELPSTLDEAIAWVQRELEQQRVAPLEDPHSVEVLGWLELALDDAPALLLAGMHDGSVPESVNGDAFLPNQIRTKLGLLDNSRRYARDCYYLQVMLHARPHLRIITNHLNVEGTPQTPSRLLLAVQPDELADRITRILKPALISTPSVHKIWTPVAGQTEIPIPLPDESAGQEIVRMSATDFASYLNCPYRFYLKKVCRLRKVNDNSRELEANTFGTLLHDCLDKLKDSTVETSNDPAAIRRWLFKQLNFDAVELFGKYPAPAVRLQIEQARQRLAAFAEIQAEQVRAGWRLFATEADVSEEQNVTRIVDGRTVFLIGRIDRIDYHPEKNLYSIWDYKTGDAGVKPLAKHIKSKRWVELQLPLYRHLAKGLGINQIAAVGYINLPKSAELVAFEAAEFTAEQYAQADQMIDDVIRNIHAGKFWPPNYDNVYDSDEFLAITQHNVARRWDKNKSTVAVSDAIINLKQPAESIKLAVSPPGKQTSKKVPDDLEPERIELLLDDTTGHVPDSWFASKLIRASAGSGKTYQLARRVIQLLFAGEPTDSILATTFTRKAAGEILERVLTVVADAILDKNAFEQLKEMVEPRHVTLQGCKYHLSRLCADLHRLRISTLDGFYNQLARNFSLELALPPGWKLADEHESTSLKSRAISQMFSAIEHQQLQSLLSQLSKGEAIRGVWREINDTVDAGYGIYRVTTANAWSQPFEIVAPSEAAVLEAITMVESSTCDHKSYPKSRDNLLAAFHANDCAGFLKSGLATNALEGESKYSRKPIEPDISNSVAILAVSLANREFQILQIQNKAAYELLSNYHAQLDQAKTLTRLVSFDDVSQRLATWLRRREAEEKTVPQSDAPKSVDEDLTNINRRMDARIRHLLLDEFQDTSPTQWAILQPFAQDVFSPVDIGNDKTSMFCVGDTKQAIYGWRGGVAELFDSIARQLIGIEQDHLKKSFRSSPVVINFVNDLFQNLDRHDKYGNGVDAIAFWKNQFQEHETAKTNLPGYVQIYNGAAKSPSKPTEEDADEEIDATLFELCVEDLATLHHAAPLRSIAVLCRTNSEVTHMINLLRERKIDASQEGGNPLTDSAAVELILSLIELADHQSDRVAQFHVINSPLTKCLSNDLALERPLQLSANLRLRIDRDGYAATIAYLASCLSSACNQRDQLRLEQLIQLAYKYEKFNATRLTDFIAFVHAEKVSLPRPSKVRVMTIHQSKGLEFDAVFLPALQRSFSHGKSTFVVQRSDPTEIATGVTRSIGSHLHRFLNKDWQRAFEAAAIEKLQENICNFYVATTRSRQALYIYVNPTKNPVQTWASALHSIFSPEERDSENAIVYQNGDVNWNKDAQRTAQVASEDAPLDELVIAPQYFDDSNLHDIRFLPRLRPSQTNKRDTVDLRHAFEKSATIGSVVGTVVHRWFEDIRWLDGYVFDPQIAKQQALDVLTVEQMPLIDIDQWMEKFKSYLEKSSVKDLLSESNYNVAPFKKLTGRDLTIDIQNECRILELVDGQLLRGTIDRLVLVKDGDQTIAAEIIDYKTDFLESYRKELDMEEWLLAKQNRHGVQMRMYRDAIARQHRLLPQRIPMTLMLLSADEVISIPPEPQSND